MHGRLSFRSYLSSGGLDISRQDSAERRKKKRQRNKVQAALIVKGVRPRTAYRSHKVDFVLEGSGFNPRHEIRIRGKDGELLETRFESGEKMIASVRIADGEEDGELQFEVYGGNAPLKESVIVKISACPVNGMTAVPAGPFLFGSDSGSPPERPRREAELPIFACGLREVSNTEYLEFLNYIQQHGNHSLCHPDEGPLKSHVPDGWDDPAQGAPEAPVTGVDWYDAYAYAAWRGWRLPSEEEWEKAARGTGGSAFPWGDEPLAANANTAGSNQGLVLAASFKAGRSPYGLYNAAGNVWEWTTGAGPGEGQAVIRGGSYRTGLLGCRSFVRNWLDRRSRRDDLGFRCAADI